MTINTNWLAQDRDYWDSVAPSDATHYIIERCDEGVVESKFHVDEGDRYRECGGRRFWPKSRVSEIEIIPRPENVKCRVVFDIPEYGAKYESLPLSCEDTLSIKDGFRGAVSGSCESLSFMAADGSNVTILRDTLLKSILRVYEV